MDGQNRPPLNVDDVERALTDALQLEPSSGFRSRVRERVTQESMRTRWVGATPLVLAASLVIVASAFALLRDAVDERRGQIAPGSDVTLAAVPENTVAHPTSEIRLPRPIAATRPAAVTRALSDPRHAARPRVPIGREPEVLLSASEQSGVRLLFESAASGRLQLPPEMLRDLSLPLADFESIIQGANQ